MAVREFQGQAGVAAAASASRGTASLLQTECPFWVSSSLAPCVQLSGEAVSKEFGTIRGIQLVVAIAWGCLWCGRAAIIEVDRASKPVQDTGGLGMR